MIAEMIKSNSDAPDTHTTAGRRSPLFRDEVSEIRVSDCYGNFVVIRGPYFEVHGGKEQPTNT